MSGRIRTIKPELLEDDRTAGMTSDQFRLWAGCLLLADDYGNLRANPTHLAGAIFWGQSPLVPVSTKSRETLLRPSRDENEKVAQVSTLLQELVERGSLALYTVRGQRYAHVQNWERHQRVDHPSNPRIPSIKEADSGEARETLANDSGDPRPSRVRADAILVGDPDPDPGPDKGGMGGTKKRGKAPLVPLPPDWKLTDALKKYAIDRGRDPFEIAEAMRNWAESGGKVKANWDAEFRTFVGRAQRNNESPLRTAPVGRTVGLPYIEPPAEMTPEQIAASADAAKRCSLDMGVEV